MKYPSLGSVGTCLIVSTSAILGCSGSSSPSATPGTGGAVGVGGSATALSSSPGAGGAHATGGAATETGGASTRALASTTGGKSSTGGTTGSPTSATGGASTSLPGTGGAKATGGSSAATGGTKATGGAPGVGGTKATGGSSAATGGTKANGGGSAVTGGAAAGGSTGTPGSDPVKSEGCGKTSALKNGDGLKITLTSPGSGDRNYNLKLPDNYDNTHPYRLIMSYHWVGGTANDVSKGGGVAKPYYGLWELAQGSAIFAAPDGTPNTIMGSGGNMWANANGSDVEFSRQLITYLESELCVDKSRVFCEGFSMGGSMSYAMACGLGDIVRAVAVHSGGSMSGCAAHSKPVAYFMTHGINDNVCKYPSYGIPQLQDFAKTNGCTSPDPSVSQSAFAALMPTPTESTGKTPVCFDFEGCKAGYPTRACLFVGDHTPSPDGTSGWVPKESWKFLSQF